MVFGKPHAVIEKSRISIERGTARRRKRRESPWRALDQIGQRASIEVCVGPIEGYVSCYKAKAGQDVCAEQFDAAPNNQIPVPRRQHLDLIFDRDLRERGFARDVVLMKLTISRSPRAWRSSKERVG